MTSFNIYLTGVGGQGIGLLSETILRAADHAGLKVKGVDTHGLAQRGGIVVSSIRIGDSVYSPMIPAGSADLVVGLERHEALRGCNAYLKDGGSLIFYDTIWQPLSVRMNDAPETAADDLNVAAGKRNIRIIRVFNDHLKDPRMQNIAVLSQMDKNFLVPGISTEHYKAAMQDLMQGHMLKKNMALFDEMRK